MAEVSILEGQARELSRLSSTPIPDALMAGLAFVMGIFVQGLVLLHQDHEAFLVLVREDGLVQWLTFGELITMAAFSFIMSYVFGRSGSGSVAKRVWLCLSFLFLFGAMEEISWGQRILGIESPEWFLRHNRQGEINVHNLLIHGVNINRLVFGKFLAILVALYLVAVPLAYRLSGKFKHFITRWGIPIPQNYQILLFVGVTILVQLHLGLAKKAGELRELCICFVFLLILLHPYNHELFPLKCSPPRRQKVSLRNQEGQ